MIPNLQLSAQKTKIFHFQRNTIQNLGREIGNDDQKNFIDYLGFTFDGRRVQIRGKTISKYYYRAYKKIDTIKSQNADPSRIKKAGTHNLYEIYSAKGTKSSQRRFLNYIQRCERVWGKEERLARILYIHYGKIKRRLKS